MTVNTGASLAQTCGSAERGHLNGAMSEWWNRLRLRRELESLDDTILRDMGLDCGEVRPEASKPFWMN